MRVNWFRSKEISKQTGLKRSRENAPAEKLASSQASLHEKEPKVSVIVPCHNRAKFIEETMRSILKQSYHNIELIVVDDASSDGSSAIMTKVAEQDPRVKILRNEENLERAESRNKGIENASGELVCFLDSDDYWHPDKVAKQVRTMQENPDLVCCYTAFDRVDVDGNRLVPWPRQNIGYSGYVVSPLMQKNFFFSGSPMVRKDVIDKIGLQKTDRIPSEDFDYWARVAREGDIKFIPEILAYYREHDSQSHWDPIKYEENHLAIMQDTIDWFFKVAQDGIIEHSPVEVSRIGTGSLIKDFKARVHDLLLRKAGRKIDRKELEILVKNSLSLLYKHTAFLFYKKGEIEKAYDRSVKSLSLNRNMVVDPDIYRIRLKALKELGVRKLVQVSKEAVNFRISDLVKFPNS